MAPPHKHGPDRTLESLGHLEAQIEAIEERISVALRPSPEVRLLRTLPGIGAILAPLVWLEIGDVERFRERKTWPATPGLCPGSSPAAGASGMAAPAAT